MQHFPLLGSVFRQVALRTSASRDFDQPLRDSGLIHETRSTLTFLPGRERTAPKGNRKSRTLKSPIITPLIQKRAHHTQSDEVSAAASGEIHMRVPRPPSEIIVGLSSDEQPSDEPPEESPDVIVGIPERGRRKRASKTRPKTVGTRRDVLQDLSSKETTDTNEKGEPSNVFYRMCVSEAEPPSESNFVQLNEVLDRSLEQLEADDVLEQHEAFELVFLEMIRLYFIECSEQGRLLDKIRLFFASLADHIPKLRQRFEEQLAKLQEIIKNNREEIMQMEKEMGPIAEEKARIEGVISQLKTDYEQFSSHLDELNRSIAFTMKDTGALKLEADDMERQVAAKQNQLSEMDDELRSLEEQSTKTTVDSVKIAEELRGLHASLEEKKAKWQQAKSFLDGHKSQLLQINAEIEELERNLQEQEKAAAETDDQIVQVDLVSRAKSSALMEARKKRQEKGGRVSANKEKIESMFRGNELTVPSEGVVVASYDDFSLLRQLILDNPDMFQLNQDEIKAAEDGSFELEGCDEDRIGLYASKLIARTIRRAIYMYPRFEVPTQTLAKPIKWKAPGVWGISGNCRFLSLIPGNYSTREPGTLTWLIKNIRRLYDEKLQADLTAIAKKKPLTYFPEFILDFAKRNHKLEFMGHQYCWDLYITGTEFREQSLEVGTFMNAVDEVIAAESLCFALKCRDDVLKIGAVVNRRADDQNEQVTEYYLSQDQIAVCLPKWWKKRYRNAILECVMEKSIARPAAHLEAIKRYVSLNDIVATMADEFLKDNIARMHELLQQARITPRLSESGFYQFFRSMMPYLSDLQCRDLYRSTVLKTPVRIDVSQRKFKRVFRAQSLLYSQEQEKQSDGNLDDLFYSVKEEWDSKRNLLIMIRKFFEGVLQDNSESLEIRSLVTDAVRLEQTLTQSVAVRNSVEACFNYFQLTFVLDLLFSTVASFDVDIGSSALIALENCAKEFWQAK